MATRSIVAYIDKETGKVKATYCHWDGYIKGGVGEELFDNYNTYETAKSLVDACSAYISIAGEIEFMKDCEDFLHYEFQNFEEFEDFVKEGADGTDFAYIFMQREAPAEWIVYRTDTGKRERVERALQIEGEWDS